MSAHIGITVSQKLVAGLVVDHELRGDLQYFPNVEIEDDESAVVEMPREEMIRAMCDEIKAITATSGNPESVGLAIPGIVHNGNVEESPNLPQFKGAHIQKELCEALKAAGIDTRVLVMNDADAVAAGLAAKVGKLDTFIRIWTLGTGIGYGRYPILPGVWEGGHMVVTLDDKETYCGCGGRGHLEGIMGHRAMRLRFLDMEPEEIFENAKNGDERCLAFKKLWHKALAAASASVVHIGGPGKFFLTGYNTRFVDLGMLQNYIEQMVRMSPLQSYSFEIFPEDVRNEVVGAAVLASQSQS